MSVSSIAGASAAKAGVVAVARNDELEHRVGQIWLNVVRHVEDVLAGSKFGFKHFLEWADPSIEEIVTSVTKIDGLLNAMLDGGLGVYSEDAQNKALNCQQVLHLIRRVHVALKQNDQTEYDDCIHKLIKHAGAA